MAKRYLEAFGQRRTTTQWAKEYGVPNQVILSRINTLGWPVEQAVTTPCSSQWPQRNFYTVYRKSDDSILCMGTSRECADFLGIDRSSFWQAVSRSRAGSEKRYEFAVDELEEEAE